MTTPPILNDGQALVHISLLKTHPRNPRRGDLAVISESIRANGFYGALVVQRSTGHILAGNHRYLAAVELGYTELPVIWVDCSDARARKILAADNRTSDLGGYDNAALVALLEEVALEDTLIGTGYGESDMEALLGAVGDGIIKDGATELNEEDFGDFEHTCPRCGFSFDG